jgi:carbon storage regulator
MLVLSRKIAETVVIDGQVVVSVLGIQGNRVRLGIEAPRQVPVYRGELRPPDAQAEQAERIEPAEQESAAVHHARGSAANGKPLPDVSRAVGSQCRVDTVQGCQELWVDLGGGC